MAEDSSELDLSRYKNRVDRAQTWGDYGTQVPTEQHPAYCEETTPAESPAPVAEKLPRGFTYPILATHVSYSPRRPLTDQERKDALIKQAALRLVAGLEPRSLRVLGKEIGCSHTAIDNVVKRLCRRLGLRPIRISDDWSNKLKDARRLQLSRQ